MKIEEGKYYRTRDGRKVGPMVYEHRISHPWAEAGSESVYIWREDGTSIFDPDIIAEWTDETEPTPWKDMPDAEKGRCCWLGIVGRLSNTGLATCGDLSIPRLCLFGATILPTASSRPLL